MSSAAPPHTATSISRPFTGRDYLRRWIAPSIPEVLFLAVMLWLIAFTVTGDRTGMGLLRDSQTGYHIRVGEYVLKHGAVPERDFLSFTKPDEPFFAWEWLAAVASTWLYDLGGLRVIVVSCAVVLALSVLVMMRHMASRGANVLIAVFLIHLAIGASSIHYLARPHIFTLLFFAIAFWLFDRDRQQATAWIWALVPLAALWANLHGGFFGMLVSGGILAAGALGEALLRPAARGPSIRKAIRWGLVTAGCFLASLLNPYGFREHTHLVKFMRETWYLKLTEEYQPPHFLSAPGAYYGVLLGLGVLVAFRMLWRREISFALLILAWAYASSRSMRHIPIFAMATVPWIAAEFAQLWRRWIAGKGTKTLAGTLEKIAADYQISMNRTSFFVPAVSLIFLVFPLGIAYPKDFPDPLYPVSLVSRHAKEIERARVFTSDSWGHYLTFRFPEPYRIFIDGRTDFFGEVFSREYLNTMNGDPGWEETLRRYKVNMVLVPSDIGLAGRLRERQKQKWSLLEDTGSAALFRLE
jgi:hypothetical protein